MWQSIGSAILSGSNPYALTSNALIYPPLWGIFCATGYLSYTLTNNSFISYFTLKLPIIIADIFISLTIQKIVYNHTLDITKARTAMILYLFNPVTIIISSLWGMFDAIPTLFALFSIVLFSYSSWGKTIIVDQTGNGDYIQINEAITNSSDGDTIIVKAGVYVESVNIYKAITIIGEGPDVTTIVHVDYAVQFLNNLGSTLMNFTVK
ncbi:MAG: hypothetical protein ACFFDT_39760, partial [Candidatus Hodarchaeota archaeon]